MLADGVHLDDVRAPIWRTQSANHSKANTLSVTAADIRTRWACLSAFLFGEHCKIALQSGNQKINS